MSLRDIVTLSPAEKDALILSLLARIEELTARAAALEAENAALGICGMSEIKLVIRVPIDFARILGPPDSIFLDNGSVKDRFSAELGEAANISSSATTSEADAHGEAFSAPYGTYATMGTGTIMGIIRLTYRDSAYNLGPALRTPA